MRNVVSAIGAAWILLSAVHGFATDASVDLAAPYKLENLKEFSTPAAKALFEKFLTSVNKLKAKIGSEAKQDEEAHPQNLRTFIVYNDGSSENFATPEKNLRSSKYFSPEKFPVFMATLNLKMFYVAFSLIKKSKEKDPKAEDGDVIFKETEISMFDARSPAHGGSFSTWTREMKITVKEPVDDNEKDTTKVEYVSDETYDTFEETFADEDITPNIEKIIATISA